jgi:glutamate-1-semialdehyde 2,1-aminomutase
MGPADLMDRVAPLGPVYQAGTLSGNPVAMAAGIATLDALEAPGAYATLERLGARLANGWQAALDAQAQGGDGRTGHAGQGGRVVRRGSLLWGCLQDPPPRAFHGIDVAGAARYAATHRALLERGVWMAPSYYEVAFVSLAHAEADVDAVVAALHAALGADAARGVGEGSAT